MKTIGICALVAASAVATVAFYYGDILGGVTSVISAAAIAVVVASRD